MVYDQLNIPTKRKQAAAVAFLRGIGQGKVYKIEGLDEAQRKMGSLVVDVSLPQIGQPKSSTYEGEGWVIIQGQNTEKVKMAALGTNLYGTHSLSLIFCSLFMKIR